GQATHERARREGVLGRVRKGRGARGDVHPRRGIRVRRRGGGPEPHRRRDGQASRRGDADHADRAPAGDRLRMAPGADRQERRADQRAREAAVRSHPDARGPFRRDRGRAHQGGGRVQPGRRVHGGARAARRPEVQGPRRGDRRRDPDPRTRGAAPARARRAGVSATAQHAGASRGRGNAMTLTAIDWTVIVLYFVLSVAIALFYSRRAGASADEYFLSGRAVPWWLAGTSMVATTFAADTPLAVTGLTVKYGIAGNWLWWCMVMSGMLTVVFYARLWRRAGVMTDAEFAEIRYSGRPAAFLRGFRACCLALAVFALGAVGGMAGLLDALHTRFPDDAPLRVIPALDSAWMPALTFFVYLAVNWWASWYPGAEPGGGGYVAQRILSTKNERHALLAALWFNIAHYALRPWPWIVVALVSMVLYPGLADPESGYVK